MAYISNRASPLLQLALGPGGVAGNTPDQIQPVRVASLSGEVSKVSDTFGDYPAVIVRQVWPLGVVHQYDALLAKDVKHKRRKERVGKSADACAVPDRRKIGVVVRAVRNLQQRLLFILQLILGKDVWRWLVVPWPSLLQRGLGEKLLDICVLGGQTDHQCPRPRGEADQL